MKPEASAPGFQQLQPIESRWPEYDEPAISEWTPGFPRIHVHGKSKGGKTQYRHQISSDALTELVSESRALDRRNSYFCVRESVRWLSGCRQSSSSSRRYANSHFSNTAGPVQPVLRSLCWFCVVGAAKAAFREGFGINPRSPRSDSFIMAFLPVY